ncbi:MAG: TonB family protein [Myxococcota bacterium]
MVHGGIVLSLSQLPEVEAVADIEIELSVYDPAEPTETPNRVEGREPSDASEFVPGGGLSAQNIHARRSGEGGDGRGPSKVILLLPRDQDITLQDSPTTAWGVAQTQRIRTSSERRTRDTRRATPNPHDQVFLATNDGMHEERRPVAADPLEGARRAPERSREGGPASQRAGQPAGATGGPGTVVPRDGATEARSQGAVASPGVGIQDGRGRESHVGADVAHGRPPVDEGPAAAHAEVTDPRIADNRDAELLAAQMVESMVEATDRTGPERGVGSGGVGGGGAPGSGGSAGTGGRAVAFGPGNGGFAGLDTSDRRYLRWHLRLRRSVYRRLVFPPARALAMDQGWSVYEFRVRRNGSLVGAPELLRSSGFADLDAAARQAIVEAAPFSPLPEELGRGLAIHTVSLRVEHSNPMIQ